MNLRECDRLVDNVSSDAMFMSCTCFFFSLFLDSGGKYSQGQA